MLQMIKEKKEEEESEERTLIRHRKIDHQQNAMPRPIPMLMLILANPPPFLDFRTSSLVEPVATDYLLSASPHINPSPMLAPSFK
jgi:hypothetical protein